MNITKENIDPLNLVLKLHITKADIQENVNATLNEYRKKVNIPGFRKGHVPLGLMRKKFGEEVTFGELGTIAKESIEKYIKEENLNTLFFPIPVEKKTLDWKANDFFFEFDLGLIPEIKIDLQTEKPITYYKFILGDSEIEKRIAFTRKQLGERKSIEKVEKDCELVGTFTNQEKGIDASATFSIENIKGKENEALFLGKKTGDTISLNTNGLFKEEGMINTYLKTKESGEEQDFKDLDLDFTINKINSVVPADLNQGFFDLITGKDQVKTVDELKDHLVQITKSELEEKTESELLNQIYQHLTKNIEFDLPSRFIKKWILQKGEDISPEELDLRQKMLEREIRYNTIRNKILEDNNVDKSEQALRTFINQQMHKRFRNTGDNSTSIEELAETAVNNILSNEQLTSQLNEHFLNEKMINIFKEKGNLESKEISYDKFLKIPSHKG